MSTFNDDAGLLNMQVLAYTRDAVYLRLPPELQRDCGGCDCKACKQDPTLAKWDTLVVPVHADPRWRDTSHTVHLPEPAVAGFKAAMATIDGTRDWQKLLDPVNG